MPLCTLPPMSCVPFSPASLMLNTDQQRTCASYVTPSFQTDDKIEFQSNFNLQVSLVKQQMINIGSKLLNNVEISAQEAMYILLQLPMRKASRQVIIINTSPPEDRVELLKPMNDIQNMDDDCDEIYASGY